MFSIILRCYNRLEYTIQALNSIRKSTISNDYEIIIVNNNSNDGTKEGLEGIQKKSPYFSERTKILNSEKNYGDFGGFRVGCKMISKNSEYIVQFDNDIIVPNGGDKYLVGVSQKINSPIVMLYRDGVQQHLQQTNIRNIDLDGEIVTICDVPGVCALYILSRKEFMPYCDKINICDDITRTMGVVGTKILNVHCLQNEGGDGNVYLQKIKYSPSDKDMWEKII